MQTHKNVETLAGDIGVNNKGSKSTLKITDLYTAKAQRWEHLETRAKEFTI